MPKILVVDDEKDIVELISYNLENEGYAVAKSYDGESALKIIRAKKPDLVILDLMLPGINGIDVCKSLRAQQATSDLPIIMLTAKADEVDKVVGLEIGADDYITKPFSVKELMARIRSILRRVQDKNKTKFQEKFSHAGLDINYASCKVSVHGKDKELSPTELKLLFFFSQHPGRVYTRDQIIDHVWGDGTFITPRAVDVHIRRLRSQIEKDAESPKYILTVRGFGYKFTDIK